MKTYVSLLRGINVGGNHSVKMPDLQALYADLELQDITTYIQSGNVIFASDSDDDLHLASRLEAAFEQRFGFHADIIVRTSVELRDICAHSPFLQQPERDLKWITVIFLAHAPSESAQAVLRARYQGPEEWSVRNRELYVYYPDGIGRSKLTHALIERALQTTGTARNWNTVQRLLAIGDR